MSFEDKSIKKVISTAPIDDSWGSPSWERWFETLRNNTRSLKAYKVDFGEKDVSSPTKLEESIDSLSDGDMIVGVNVNGNDTINVLNSYVTRGKLNVVFEGGTSENLSNCYIIVMKG